MTATATAPPLVVEAGPPARAAAPPGWFALVVAGLVAVVVLVVAGPILFAETTEDWRAYEQAAGRLAAGGPLYVWELADTSQEYYLYPPPMAALWGIGFTWQALLVVKVVALAGVGSLVAGPGPWRPAVAGVLVAVTLISAPVLHDLILGNVMALYVGAVALALARPGWIGAAPLGALIAIAAKPAIGPVLLWMLLVRRGQFVKAFIAGLATTAVFVLWLGVGRYVEYLEALPRMAVLATPFTGNVGTAALSRELGLAGVIVAYLWTGIAAWRLDARAAAVVAVSMTLLAQPTIGFNYAGLLIPGVVVLWGLHRPAATVHAALLPLIALATPVGAAFALAGTASLSRTPRR